MNRPSCQLPSSLCGRYIENVFIFHEVFFFYFFPHGAKAYRAISWLSCECDMKRLTFDDLHVYSKLVEIALGSMSLLCSIIELHTHTHTFISYPILSSLISFPVLSNQFSPSPFPLPIPPPSPLPLSPFFFHPVFVFLFSNVRRKTPKKKKKKKEKIRRG